MEVHNSEKQLNSVNGISSTDGESSLGMADHVQQVAPDRQKTTDNTIKTGHLECLNSLPVWKVKQCEARNGET